MDVEKVVAVYYTYDRYIKGKKKKKYWIHPFFQTRDETRHFEIYFEDLKKYEVFWLHKNEFKII